MKKILLIMLLSIPLLGQVRYQTSIDSVYLGDSTNTHQYQNSHEMASIVITSSVANDTLRVYTSPNGTNWSRADLKKFGSVSTGWVNEITGNLITSSSENIEYLIFAPRTPYIKVVRKSQAGTTVKYKVIYY